MDFHQFQDRAAQNLSKREGTDKRRSDFLNALLERAVKDFPKGTYTITTPPSAPNSRNLEIRFQDPSFTINLDLHIDDSKKQSCYDILIFGHSVEVFNEMQHAYTPFATTLSKAINELVDKETT